MALQIVFSNNLNPSAPNLSSRFKDAIAFYLAAPLINAELEIDVFLQVYFLTLTGEVARNIPLGKISEQVLRLNVADTETVSVIPAEFLNTGLEMALLFLASDSTFVQAAVIKPDCSLNQICQRLEAIESALNLVAPPTNSPTSAQTAFFFLQ